MEGKASLFQRVGGMNTIHLVVDQFYNRVMSDDKINHFFQKSNLKALRSKQAIFLAYVFGAPSIQTDFDLKKAHAHLSIEDVHFERILLHLKESLQALSFDTGLQEEIMTIVQRTKQEILGN